MDVQVYDGDGVDRSGYAALRARFASVLTTDSFRSRTTLRVWVDSQHHDFDMSFSTEALDDLKVTHGVDVEAVMLDMIFGCKEFPFQELLSAHGNRLRLIIATALLDFLKGR